jgi:hypothetical protein
MTEEELQLRKEVVAVQKVMFEAIPTDVSMLSILIALVEMQREVLRLMLFEDKEESEIPGKENGTQMTD